MSYIEINGVDKFYNQKKVLDIPHLEIQRGEIVALLGKNGSGKSTLLKIISVLLYPTHGHCTIEGISSSDPRMKHTSKFVLESGKGYYDYLTAQENIDYFLSLNKVNMKKEENIQKLNSYVKNLYFEEHLDKKCQELSQGNRQKLPLIVLLMTNPDIICLDEPTNGLDISSVNLFMSFLYNICKRENKTIIFTTHDISFVKSLNSRVLLSEEGELMRDEESRVSFGDLALEKTLVEVSVEDLPLLESLNYTQYEFSEDKISLSV